jgi:hypothetical protein
MDNLLEILKLLMALLNIGFGLFAIARPEVLATASHFTLNNPRGRTEFRILSGGFFVGMGVGAALFGSFIGEGSNAAYQVVGAAWLMGGATRLLNLALEDPKTITDRQFWILLASELIPGAILIAPN